MNEISSVSTKINRKRSSIRDNQNRYKPSRHPPQPLASQCQLRIRMNGKRATEAFRCDKDAQISHSVHRLVYDRTFNCQYDRPAPTCFKVSKFSTGLHCCGIAKSHGSNKTMQSYDCTHSKFITDLLAYRCPLPPNNVDGRFGNRSGYIRLFKSTFCY